MTETATMTAIVPVEEKEAHRLIDAQLPDGQSVRVTIPARFFADLAEAVQSFLLRRLSLAQSTGGVANLDVTNLRLSHRPGEGHRLQVTTHNLGTVGLKLTTPQWAELEGLVAQVRGSSEQKH